MKRVLITGGAGFIGFHLAKRLIGAGFAVDLWDDYSRGVVDEELRELSDHAVCTCETRDLTQPIEDARTDYDFIFNFAAIVGVANVLGAPYNTLYDNALILMRMIDFARSQKNLGRFVFSSTSEVYAGTLACFGVDIPTPEDTPLAIADPTDARASYMLSKVFGEALLANSGVKFTNVRFHNIYGPRMGLSHVVPELLKKAYELGESEPLPVYSPKHTRAFCYIDDAVSMLLRIIETPGCANNTYNIGAEDAETTIEALARIILDTVGKDNSMTLMPDAAGSPARRAPAMGKLLSDIGPVPVTTLADGIKQTFEWYQKKVFIPDGISAK